MSGTKDANSGSDRGRPAENSEPKDERADRLAAALRDNLKKRKAQARERAKKPPNPGEDGAV